jgi:hypothetical protein
LLLWYEEGVDIDRMMPLLSIYLGHAVNGELPISGTPRPCIYCKRG